MGKFPPRFAEPARSGTASISETSADHLARIPLLADWLFYKQSGVSHGFGEGEGRGSGGSAPKPVIPPFACLRVRRRRRRALLTKAGTNPRSWCWRAEG